MATKSKKPSRKEAIAGALALARIVGQLPAPTFFLDFDEEADVLYISLKRPQQATNTIEVNDGETLLCYRHRELVGITVLNASKR